MQPLTFTPKLLRPRRFFSFLLPLFALFVGVGSTQTAQGQASTISASNVLITVSGANRTYDAVPTAGGTNAAGTIFAGTDFGPYDVANGQFVLQGGSFSINQAAGENYSAANLYYRVYQTGTTSTFTAVPLTVITNTGSTRTFSASVAAINLLANAAVAGNAPGTPYNFDIYFQASGVDANNVPITLPSAASTTLRNSTFQATGVPTVTDTWNGTINDDWFNPGNWDLGRIPDQNTNVRIPNFPSASGNIYPNINADVNYTPQRSNLSTGSTAGGQNANSGPALCKDLLLDGISQLDRSICRLVSGTIKIYGSFYNLQDSWIQRLGTINGVATAASAVTEFASPTLVTISGGRFTRVAISGGGQKTLTGGMFVEVSLTFTTNGGLLTTNTRMPNTNFVELSSRSSDAVNGAQLVNETNESYLRGYSFTTRDNVGINEGTDPTQPISATNPIRFRTYGNQGFDINFKTGNPGTVTVTRNTAESYTPLNAGGTASAYGIRRVFGVRPGNTTGLTADTRFHYLTSELTGLGPDGSGSVNEPDLALFISTDSGNNFGLLGRDSPPVNQTLPKSNVRTFATFTLGDITRPLPVSLTGFDAKRIGADALVTWQTASEQHNKGFNVQVSNDGKNYRNIGFVASENPNSTSAKAYAFTDSEKNKVGARYYRLEQLDVDGKSTFFAPRVVTFDGKTAATSSSIVAYPNPLNNEILHLSLNSAVNGIAVVRVLDMTGRQVAQRQSAINIGSNDIALENMSELKSGLYIMNISLPSGEKKSMKVVKQ